jgi:hypothetical protein
MHRFRSWTLTPTELRTQRNRILPISGENNPNFNFNFTSTTETLLKEKFNFTRAGTNATYIASNGLVTTAVADVPRFEYSTAGQPIGLLLEGTGKNWFKYSEDQSNAVWQAYTNGSTPKSVTKNNKSSTYAPDGSQNGNRIAIIGTGNNGLYQVLPADLKTNSINKPITVSVWAWTETGTATMAINYFNGAASSLGNPETLTTTPRRITRTITLSGDPSVVQNVTISNSGSDAAFVWWGYQVEDGYQASSYIKTTTDPATREPDSLTMTGTLLSSWFKHTEGTVLMSFDYRNQNAPTASVSPRLVFFTPSVYYDPPYIGLRYSVQGQKFFVIGVSGLFGTGDIYTPQSYSPGTNMQIAWSYSNQTRKTIISANGDTPSIGNHSIFFAYTTSGIAQLNFTGEISSSIMHLKSFTFWNEAKPAEELQSLANNNNPGFSAIGGNTIYLSGDIGSLLLYNRFAEGPTYSSLLGGSAENDYVTASKAIALTDFSFGMRIVVTKGAYADMVGNIGYNLNDNYMELYDVNNPVAVGIGEGDEIAFGLFANLPAGLAGRIEIYEWDTKQTITSFEFRT